MKTVPVCAVHTKFGWMKSGAEDEKVPYDLAQDLRILGSEGGQILVRASTYIHMIGGLGKSLDWKGCGRWLLGEVPE